MEKLYKTEKEGQIDFFNKFKRRILPPLRRWDEFFFLLAQVHFSSYLFFKKYFLKNITFLKNSAY